MRALRAQRDVWGDELLGAPGGPSYERARRYLAPLRYARAAGKTALGSGVYYLPFAKPQGAQGAGSVALHVADGSRIHWQRVDGRTLRVSVGGRAFASCTATLADGWLPILQTRDGRYAQESFTAGETYVHVAPPARFNGVRAEYVRWDGRSVRPVDATAYAAARAGVVDYWTGRLAEGAAIDVPERRVANALRASLVQDLTLTWRYSIGNAYEQFSFPESVDVAQVLAEYGHALPARSILRVSLTRRAEPYPSWKMGEKLLGWGAYHRLHGDHTSLAQATPALHAYVLRLRAAMTPRGLLRRERYSSDIPDQVYGLHAQAVVWQGLNEIADAWAATGREAYAGDARLLAARLERGLHAAVRASQRRLPDGSLFVPVRLLDGEQPYASVTESRAGSYWNLVAPYAFASGILTPAQSEGAFRYLQNHGSRLLGLVRAGAYALYRDPMHPVSGTDQVYGINVARFLALLDEPDQLVLSLYGTLAAGMTHDTFVGGEAASVAPLHGAYARSMYLPPNGATSAAYLETLRSLLVHDTRRGLDLAFATPRAWLAPGKRIAVRDLPTRFGPLTYSLQATAAGVRFVGELPRTPRTRLRLRLPAGGRTLDLSGRSGHVEITVAFP
jgi:hypothetical protein